MNTKRTITLTGRPPVTITEDSWPVLASATDRGFDGEHECQAFRTELASIYIRQHADGRAIVYAVYDFSTAWPGERDEKHKAGILLDGATPQAICDAIRDIADEMPGMRLMSYDWGQLACEAIADMPATCID